MEAKQYPQRLMIREMVLDNFKSYAGKQPVGPFHKCFSSVVGPNGSGKSNVIDAMLFVFGRRAKQLRFNKVSELIHNSTNHRNLDQARVTVYFQEIIDKEGDNYTVVPNSEFTVTRTANRDNSSHYYVNDKKVSTKEVTTLLKAKGIDLDNNRFLILQGEVEQISLMKPKAEDKNETGLLEYLEDIIDTAKYIEPIEQEAKKLEEVNERRQAMINKLRIVEKEKEQLEGKKLQAEAYMDKQAESTLFSIKGNKITSYKAQSNIKEIDSKMSEVAAKLQHEKEKFSKFDEELKQHDQKHQAAEADVAHVQKALEEAQERFKEFERKDVKVRADLKHLKAKLKTTTGKLAKDKETIQSLEADIERLQNEIPRDEANAEKTASELQRQEQVLEGMQDSIKGEVEQLHQQLSKVRQELAPWEAKMQAAQSHVNIAKEERDLLTRSQRDAEKALQQAQQGLEAAKQGARAKEKQIAEIQKAMEASRRAAEKAKRDVDACQAEEQQLEGTLRELRARVQLLRSDLQSQQASSGTMKAISAAVQKGELTGVYGRLGDLGAIDAKYDVAISTACGALDYIVVESASEAQRLVEYLRRNNLGVATCLILEKQRHLMRAMAEKVEAPEPGSLRLFDLVKPRDNDMKLAFYWALRNTLVAQDLEQASRIAYGRDKRFSRVVTLEGQLIAESGTMTGGGSKPRGGRICLGNAAPRAVDSKAAAAELQRAEQELQQQADAHRRMRQQFDQASAAFKEAEAQLAKLERDLPRVQMELDADKQKAQDLQQRLQELQAATKTSGLDAGRLAELEQAIKAGEKELAQLNKSAASLQQQAAQLQQQVDNAGGEKLRKQKALVGKLGKSLEELESAPTKKGVQVKNSQKQLEKLRKEIGKQETELEKTDAGIKAANTDIKELEEQAFKVMQLVEATTTEKAEREAALAEVRGEKERKQEEVGIIQNVQVELESKAEKLKALKTEQSHLVRESDKEVQKLMAKLKEHTDKPAQELSEEELAAGDADDCFAQVAFLGEQLRTMSPDLGAIEEFRQKEAEFSEKHNEMKAITEERDVVRREYDRLRKQRLDEFMEGFNIISMKLKEMYQMITLGGDAELELVDSLDPFSEGIVFSVRPPKKSWKNISNLSGGEKTLSSLSLVFALHHYKPTPLYVMDEIDAALDFKNVSIVGHYIKEQTKNAQFVIISLRNNMFELADRLHGIYKTDNCTKTVTINPGEFVVGRQQQRQQQQGQQQQQQHKGAAGETVQGQENRTVTVA